MARNANVSRRWRPGRIHEDNEQVHVLAVDDSLVDRKVIERLLKITSCKVTAVDSGRRALQFLGLDHEEKKSSSSSNSIQVDLIITDYCMPGMTGFELLKIIKESSTFKKVPVVIMSSENVIARIDRCLEEGAEDFIVKPVKLSDVKRLRDYMTARELNFKDQRTLTNGTNHINRRKSSGSCCHLPSLPPPLFLSSSSPCRLPSPSPRPMLSYSAPCSPTAPLDSPPRSLKLSSFD